MVTAVSGLGLSERKAAVMAGATATPLAHSSTVPNQMTPLGTAGVDARDLRMKVCLWDYRSCEEHGLISVNNHV